jgi:hypothetical protein
MELHSIYNAGKKLVADWISQYGEDHPKCCVILQRLPGNATDEQINAAFASLPFGHSNRVCRDKKVCGECKSAVDAVVQIGEGPDCESRTAYVCRSCLLKALHLVGEQNVQHR